MYARSIVTLLLSVSLALVASCTTRGRGDVPDSGLGNGTDAWSLGGHDSGTIYVDTGTGSCSNGTCYTVYAHSDHVLYSVDLAGHNLTTIGPFQHGSTADTMTDLAVASNGTIYVVSHTSLYTANPTTGAATMVASLASCGTETVALSLGTDGLLYAGDFSGAFCAIDISNPSAPHVVRTMTLSGGYALSGDLVVVGDGTMFGTVYHIGDPSTGGTQINNILARIDPATGMVTTLGSTGYPKLFGVAYQNGQVFGFTHDGSGDVITIDRMTGVGTLFGTFHDTSTGRGISFAGAGVNVNVPIAPM